MNQNTPVQPSVGSSKEVSPTPPIPYTIFTKRQKYLITFLLGLATIASPLTATIYLPLLPILRTHFHTSSQAINLTITLYIIFQALSPVLFATLSDSIGRRPIYLLTFALYTLASLGLALNKKSYVALLLLRALQSLGASAVLAVGYGVVADVCVPAERGKMLGPVMAATNLGSCIGPIIGGWVALGSGGYEWVFWSLLIFGFVVLGTIGGWLPETSRNVVGNGSVGAKRWAKTWWNLFGEWNRTKEKQTSDDAHDRNRELRVSSPRVKTKFQIPNPLACLQIVFWKDTSLILWMSASFYSVYYCVQTAIPSIYKDIYNFNEFQIGLSYLTGGAGVVLGGFVNGRIMDRNYDKTAKEIGHIIDRFSGDDLNYFPIEKARARSSWYLLAISICTLVGYGWALQKHCHESISLLLQFVLGFICTCFLQTFNALLVDIFPHCPSTAATAGNITRCALSAVAVATVQPLIDALGRGWYFTFLGILSGLGGAAATWALQTRGMKWRGQRRAKVDTPSTNEDSAEKGLTSVSENADGKTRRIVSAGNAQRDCHEESKIN